MDPLALGWIAIAAVLHATWNILLKSAGDPLRTATAGMTAVSIVLVPAAGVAWTMLGRPAIPAEAWVLGIVSGAVEVAYFVFLAAAYARGDLSVVYPLARGTAPLLAVGLGVGVLGERLPAPAWVGIGLLVAGLLVVQRPWRLVGTSRRADRAGAGFALLTGAAIAGYSALDRVGVQLAPAWAYAAILWPACAAGLLLTVGVRRRMATTPVAAGAHGTIVPAVARPFDVRVAVVGGFLTFTAYGFVLAALSRAPLAIVAPLRESSVLLASLWGIVRLREASGVRELGLRLGGALLVLGGAAVLAVAR